jgi:hypothetical protein
MCLAAMVVVANILDLASTRLASPNLANEWNVLERTFGLGWAGLIIAKLIGGAAAVLGYRYYLLHRKKCYPLPGRDMSNFCRYMALGHSGSFPSLFRSKKAWRRVGVNLGYFWAGLQALVLWVALDNMLLLYGGVNPIRNISETGYHLLQSWLVAGLVLCRFYRVNFREYQQKSPAAEAIG